MIHVQRTESTVGTMMSANSVLGESSKTGTVSIQPTHLPEKSGLSPACSSRIE